MPELRKDVSKISETYTRQGLSPDHVKGVAPDQNAEIERVIRAGELVRGCHGSWHATGRSAFTGA